MRHKSLNVYLNYNNNKKKLAEKIGEPSVLRHERRRDDEV